jgi:hypothetical protein
MERRQKPKDVGDRQVELGPGKRKYLYVEKEREVRSEIRKVFQSRANTAMWLDLDHMTGESTYGRYGNR